MGCHFTKHKFKDQSIKNVKMVTAELEMPSAGQLGAVECPEGRPGSLGLRAP